MLNFIIPYTLKLYGKVSSVFTH